MFQTFVSKVRAQKIRQHVLLWDLLGGVFLWYRRGRRV